MIEHLRAWVKWWRAWGEASRIAFTGPPSSESESPIGTKLACLRCMVFHSPVVIPILRGGL